MLAYLQEEEEEEEEEEEVACNAAIWGRDRVCFCGCDNSNSAELDESQLESYAYLMSHNLLVVGFVSVIVTRKEPHSHSFFCALEFSAFAEPIRWLKLPWKTGTLIHTRTVTC
jgi:hypothetical protein